VNQLGFKMNNLRLQIAEESKVAGPENRDMMASMANAAKERKEKNVILKKVLQKNGELLDEDMRGLA
jgi:hypothetical protein